jgi:hypothetical protein
MFVLERAGSFRLTIALILAETFLGVPWEL